MFVSIAVAALHFGVNHLLVNTLGLGFLGAAWAIVIASFNTTALTALWVAVTGMKDRVWGKPTWQAFQVTPLMAVYCSASLSCSNASGARISACDSHIRLSMIGPPMIGTDAMLLPER